MTGRAKLIALLVCPAARPIGPSPTAGGGRAIRPDPGTGMMLNALALQRNGRILAGGTLRGSFLVRRLLVDGSRDDSFSPRAPRSRHNRGQSRAPAAGTIGPMARLGPVAIPEVARIAQPVGRERALAEVARRQHGVITLAQLRAIGFSPSAARKRVVSGRLLRLHRGVYAIAGLPLSPHAHWIAAVVVCGPGAVLSHQSAAALWGFRESAATRIDVTSPGRTGRLRPGIRVHRADRLAASEITDVAGIPCTTVARTVVDLAGGLGPEALEYAIHRAQIKRLVERDEILEVVARSPTRRGSRVVRRLLGHSSVAEDRVRSLGERRMIRICARAGLPMPRVNAWIALDGDGLEVDFSWRDQRLAVEVDSLAHHATARAFENDSRRDRRLMRAGWRVARFTNRDVTERPDAVAAELRALLGV